MGMTAPLVSGNAVAARYTRNAEGNGDAAATRERDLLPEGDLRDLKILIVAEDASLKFGGEATKPVLFFDLYRKRGLDVRMLVHERCKDDLLALFPRDTDRLYFTPDSVTQKVLCHAIGRLPRTASEQTLGFVSHQIAEARQRQRARELVREFGIAVVHEPTPISPKQTSMMYDLGAPVVIGPMCGGMDYPPAFQYMQSGFARNLERAGRGVAQVFHAISPGKLQAAALIVANDRTRLALPRG